MDMNKVLDEFDNYLFYRYVHLIAETVLIVLRLKYNKVLKRSLFIKDFAYMTLFPGK